jgi:limonene-1,2-epoxide hydrolase
MEAFFTADFVYLHLSLDRPIVGPKALAGMIEVFRARFEQIESEVLHLGEVEGQVLCERIDRFGLPGGRRFAVSAMASVQVRDGRIAQWRDYFDIAFLKRNVDVTEG